MNEIVDSFESPKILIKGAREDIQDFSARCGRFVDSCRSVPVEEFDPQTSEKIIKLRVTNQIPSRLRYLTSGIVNHLRHALDQAVNAAAIDHGASRRDCYFPFAKGVSEIDKAIKERCKSIPAEMVAFLKAFQPYGGGYDLLYALGRPAGPNKHQIALKVEIDMPYLQSFPCELRYPASFGFFSWDSHKQELELARVGPGGYFKFNAYPKLPLFVTIGDGQALSGKPAAAILDGFAGKVEGIVAGIEAETARLLRERSR